MKKLLFINVLFITVLSFGQSKTATTLEGKEGVSKNINKLEARSCVIPEGFEEPKWNSSKIRTRNKTRVSDLKKYISNDTGVSIDSIFLVSFKDTVANGIYTLCVDGNEMKYIRTGNVFRKDTEKVSLQGL